MMFAVRKTKESRAMPLVNLTPHAINILSSLGIELDPKTRQLVASADAVEMLREIPSDGVARVSVTTQPDGEVDGIPCQCPSYGEIDGLPDYSGEAFYIVSLLTVSAAKAHGRTCADLLTPGRVVRDKDNGSRILGCLDLNRA